ncbi:MAG: hypothetical protein ABH891_04290, partial [Candidatus Omnitrophota bacterium]
SGIVTVPFVTISNVFETIKAYSTEHEVQKGDYVSKLVSREYGPYGTKSYEEGIKLFQLVNPNISDLDRIYPGQVLYVPITAIRSQPWFQSLLENIDSGTQPKDLKASVPVEVVKPEPVATEDKEDPLKQPFKNAASVLDATLINQGVYFFPRQGKEDLKLDLSQFPVMEGKDGRRILFSGQESMNPSDLEAIKSFWGNLEIMPVSRETSLEQILDAVFQKRERDAFKNGLSFTDNGLEVKIGARWIIPQPGAEAGKKERRLWMTLIDHESERMPDSIVRYLEHHDILIKDILKNPPQDRPLEKERPEDLSHDYFLEDVFTIGPSDPKAFVNDLLMAMGYAYFPNVQITFPYADIQISTLSNRITKKDGTEMLVDFGDLYGDAIHALENAGFEIVQIKEKDNLRIVILKLLSAIGETYSMNPTFLAAKRAPENNASLSIPGFLVERTGKPKTLLTPVSLPKEVAEFLKNEGVKSIMVGLAGKY